MKSCSVLSRGGTAYDSAAFHVSLNHVDFTIYSYIKQSHDYILSNTKYISVSELSAVFLRNYCFGFVQGILCTNIQTRVQSIQMGLFVWKVLSVPDEFFYLSIIVERFTMYNLVVLNLWERPSIFFLLVFYTIQYHHELLMNAHFERLTFEPINLNDIT